MSNTPLPECAMCTHVHIMAINTQPPVTGDADPTGASLQYNMKLSVAYACLHPLSLTLEMPQTRHASRLFSTSKYKPSTCPCVDWGMGARSTRCLRSGCCLLARNLARDNATGRGSTGAQQNRWWATLEQCSACDTNARSDAVMHQCQQTAESQLHEMNTTASPHSITAFCSNL